MVAKPAIEAPLELGCTLNPVPGKRSDFANPNHQTLAVPDSKLPHHMMFCPEFGIASLHQGISRPTHY